MTKSKKDYLLKSAYIDTPLGPMLAISDEEALYLLEFADRRSLERQVDRIKTKTKAIITAGQSEPIKLIKSELQRYFDGSLKEFTTPLQLLGSTFQEIVWEELMRIPYGQTRSYSDQAKAIGKQKAYRAVANANGANKLAIIIPCHRIINSNGDLGGYGGGVNRKKWLIDFEKKNHFIVV
ncbi:MAG: methylated-DNA--[protein]-cysteine S-methyltransferase [Rickettsiaceae bacterium]|nr:methylated-DNA--[protein]-cysteine S-methyltransferase [Rickettsiaceae bacterium]